MHNVRSPRVFYDNPPSESWHCWPSTTEGEMKKTEVKGYRGLVHHAATM